MFSLPLSELTLSALTSALKGVSFIHATWVLTLLNVLQFTISMGLAWALTRWITREPISPQEDLQRSAPSLLGVTMIIALNSSVAVAGWLLWRADWITVQLNSTSWQIIGDLLALLFMMDAAMYISHRVAHAPLLYHLIHEKHHRGQRPRPIDLFYLSPIEVCGYGGLWISVLIIYPSSIEGILIYLTLNLIFGTIGHLGYALSAPSSGITKHLEPLLKHLGGSRFHAEHHRSGDCNYGFYTLIWDRIFGTARDGTARDGTAREEAS